MFRRLPLTTVALIFLAAPAFAQDDDGGSDLDRVLQGVERLVEKVKEKLEPLIEKIEETLRGLVATFEEWIAELDPGQMFGEFDPQQWLEELRRMMEGMGPGGEDNEEY